MPSGEHRGAALPPHRTKNTEGAGPWGSLRRRTGWLTEGLTEGFAEAPDRVAHTLTDPAWITELNY